MIWFKPFPGDWQDWVERGAAGWEPEAMEPYYERLRPKHQIVADKDRNALLLDWILGRGGRSACRPTRTGTPAPFHDGAGFLDVGYDPATGVRSSSSVRTCTRSWANAPT